MNARTQAVARMNEDQDASVQRAIAAREEQERPKNALEAMAMRLQVSTAGLKDTLMKTVFKECRNDAEFIALIVVANQYNLDPLRKEIYAFPAKGGGVVPMIGYDGWIRIMNEHPQFDALEFDHIVDEKGKVTAVEGILYRKDRTRPTKKIVYLDEFKIESNPNWKSRPNHMLDVRCLCHTVRIGLGVSGGVEGDEADMAEYRDVTPQRLPSNDELDTRAQTIDHDPDTGEVQDDEPARDEQTGMTELSEDEARALDAAQTYQDLDGPVDDETQDDSEPEEEEAQPAGMNDAQKAILVEIERRIAKAEIVADIRAADAEWQKHKVTFPESVVKSMDEVIYRKAQRVGEVAARGGK